MRSFFPARETSALSPTANIERRCPPKLVPIGAGIPQVISGHRSAFRHQPLSPPHRGCLHRDVACMGKRATAKNLHRSKSRRRRADSGGRDLIPAISHRICPSNRERRWFRPRHGLSPRGRGAVVQLMKGIQRATPNPRPSPAQTRIGLTLELVWRRGSTKSERRESI